MAIPKEMKRKYDPILKKFPLGYKTKRPRPPSQAELKKDYDAGDPYIGKDEKGRYYLD